MNDTTPLDIQPDAGDRLHLAAAAEHYCKHLDNLARAAADMGRAQEEVVYAQEAEKWRAELVAPVLAGEDVVFYPRHMPVLEQGCIFVAKRMKAAKGTLTPFLSYDIEIAKLESDAKRLLNELSVMFTPVMAGQAAEGEPS